MITFKTLTLQNFLSTGNVPQTIDLNNNFLTLIIGENLDQGGEAAGYRNGVGKSSILNAISYALYGQALTKIKKDNLINKRNNKQMLVKLAFDINGVQYEIHRGRKPGVLKFIREGIDNTITDDAQGDSRNTQQSITTLLKMGHSMFAHIIALNTYSQPFLAMEAGDQRTIIEQLLGISVLSEKAEALKVLIKRSNEEIAKETATIDAIKHSNDTIQRSIDRLIEKQTTWNVQHEQAINKITTSIYKLEQIDIEQEVLNHACLKEHLTNTEKSRNLARQKSLLESNRANNEKMVNQRLSEIAALTKQTCHACGQSLPEDSYITLLAASTNALEEAKQYTETINNELHTITAELHSIPTASRPTTFYPSIEDALAHQHNLGTLESQLQAKLAEENPYDDQITELQQQAIQEIDWTVINELEIERQHQEFLLKLLTNKDSFVRKRIIDQNLSFLNKQLGEYLSKIGLPHSVIFQNDLSVEITILGQDLDFDNLSRGERSRLILGLSFAFRDVWENLFERVNLLFVDELIDNGLDASGVANSLNILKNFARDRKRNVFLISHKDELVERVDTVLMVVKENGFSSILTT
jgi:DNA repair exonuclease SbcCD ATPase subunit